MKKLLLILALLVTASSQLPAQATLATYTLTTGQATFGVALPSGSATTGLKVGALTTQTDIKTTWPNGSIKFALVTATIPSTSTYALTSAAPATGTFTPTWPTSTGVDFVIGGTTYTANLPTFSASDSWLSGPLVRESRVIVVPTASGPGAHALLRVIFDVRSYAAGGHRIDITVDNTKNQAGANSVTYDLAIRVANSTVYTKAALTHSYLTRWRKTFTTSLTESAVTPDFTPTISAGLLPSYLPTVVNQSYPAPTTTAYDPLGFGSMYQDMSSPGGRPDISPFPYWTAQYLVHRTASQRAFVLANANISGSWSGHITNPDGTLIVITSRPGFWLEPRGNDGGGDGPVTANGSSIPGTTNAMENAHIPSLNYVPYLLTGDRWHLDQMRFWANFTILWTWPGDSGQPRTGGLLTQNQPRGIGWSLRLLAETAAILPDADTYKTYFTNLAQTNISWLDNYATTDVPAVPAGALRDLTLWNKFNNGGTSQLAQWQLSYVAYAMYHAQRLGFTTTGSFINRVARFQISLLTSAGVGYPQIYGAPYYLDIGTYTYDGAYHYTLRQSLQAVFNATYNNGAAAPQPIPGYYGPETAILLRLGIFRSLPNAATALAYLRSQTNVDGDIDYRSGFALAIDDTVTTPTPPPPTPEVCGDGIDNDLDGLIDEGCPPPPPPTPATGTLTATPNPCQMATGQSTCASTIEWNAVNTPSAAVFVTPQGATPILMACGVSASSTVPWIGTAPSVFTFYAVAACDGNTTVPAASPLASVTVTGLPPATSPAPVNCAVTAFGAWSAWTPINATQEQRIRTRTITVQPSGGGTACPTLSEAEVRTITVTPPPDTTAPTVSISTPSSGVTLGGSVALAATSADNAGVVGVQFTLDGSALGSEDFTAPYGITWTTTGAADGAHTLRAVARDAATNSTTSAAVTVTVANAAPADTTAPTVSVTSPVASATLSGTVSVTAASSDAVGVVSVQFTLDGVDLGALDTTPAYSVSWNTLTATNATHTLRAFARDAAGNIGASTSISVLVNNVVVTPPPPSPPVSIITTTIPVSRCRLTLSANQSPDGTSGWTVRFRRNGLSHGSRDSSAPYSQVAEVVAGSYILTAEWTKGAVISRITVGTYVCPVP